MKKKEIILKKDQYNILKTTIFHNKFMRELIMADFVHTEKHQSKIFLQITINDDEIREACLNHHNGERLSNPYHSPIQYYDGLAS